MKVIELVDEMQGICEKLRQDGHRIRFIPTMGALHIGHASLIETAAHDPPLPDEVCLQEEEHVSSSYYNNASSNSTKANLDIKIGNYDPQRPTIIVSIFTNPTQFDRASDSDNYPKTDEADLRLCNELLVDYVFMPRCQEIYPLMGSTNRSQFLSCNEYFPQCMIEPPTELNNDLEGRSREGHFRGMLTIVCKLFNIIRPHDAYFGEKDYQQMMIVKRMVRDLNINVRIRPVPTVREQDMLPLSSRNVRLSDGERQAAPSMCMILQDTKQTLESMNNINIQIKQLNNLLMASMLTSTVLSSRDAYKVVHPDYLQLRCSEDFSKIEYQDQELKFFDCLEGCVRKRVLRAGRGSLVLKTRLLVACIIGDKSSDGIRLLDNIEVELNNNLVI